MSSKICPACGNDHDEIAGSIPVTLPTAAVAIAKNEHESRVWCNGELCVIDDEQFYIYGSIELGIHSHPGKSFLWGAWAEVDSDRFFDYQDLLNDEARDNCSPVDGMLATDIPFYSSTLQLPLTIHIQRFPNRPLFVLHASDHVLAADQANGVSVEYVLEIRKWFKGISGSRALTTPSKAVVSLPPN